MPELPEVETVVRQLRPRIVGAQIRGFKVVDAKLGISAQRQSSLPGMSIGAVERHGKQIAIQFQAPPEKPIFMLVHLRMTGRLIFSSEPIPLATKYLRAIFTLEGGWL